MRTSIIAISCLAVAALGQTHIAPVGYATISTPEGEATPTVEAPTGQAPSMPQVAQVPGSLTRSLLARLASYFDMSRQLNIDTSTPVMTVEVFDPTINRITHLSMNIVHTGDVWYLPVCSVDSIAAAGSAVASPPSTESCQYGIQLTPMPQNAMRFMMRVKRTLFRAIEAAAREPTRFWLGRPSTGTAFMPWQ
ncbi:hypothetical protein GGI18_004605 [Coemansia linderi]|uniref:Uncharacterized protein n=1 Tax=Coemansia linderi TaxID=2663919 RepID=A0ACC1K5V9_9FUNG|nr:hypothetical protein GGI18_004605 [Coemansia linderi]